MLEECYVAERGYSLNFDKVTTLLEDALSPYMVQKENLKNIETTKENNTFSDEILNTIIKEKKSKVLILFGGKGSGKSTFLTIAGGLQSPTSGNISINGLDFTPLSEKKRSKLRFKEIGFILQSSNLIPYLTIEEQFLLIDKINHEKLTSKKGIESSCNISRIIA